MPSAADQHYGIEVRRVLRVTLALNLLVVAGKFIAGTLAGSLSVTSDAIHSAADSLNNVVGLVIVRIASAPADAEHPFGHHKFETLGAFGIAGFLAITSYEVGLGAVRRLLGWTSGEVEVTALTLGVMLATLVVNVFVWSYERRRARELNSSFLKADSSHTLSDIFVSASVLGGLLLVQRGHVQVDAYLALAVAGVIAFAAYQIFSSTIPVLVDSAPLSSEHVAKVVRETPGVESVHEILSRGVPGKIFISMHLVVTPKDTLRAHAVTEEVERRLEQEFGPCEAVIHVEPYEGAR